MFYTGDIIIFRNTDKKYNFFNINIKNKQNSVYFLYSFDNNFNVFDSYKLNDGDIFKIICDNYTFRQYLIPIYPFDIPKTYNYEVYNLTYDMFTKLSISEYRNLKLKKLNNLQ